MKRTSFFITILLLLGIGTFGYFHSEEVNDFLQSQTESEVQTFELGTTSDAIMNANQKTLLKTPLHTFGKQELVYAPYLLLDVKYTQDNKKTQDAKVLWSLIDGEMVLNTANFETTHGLEDCILSNANDDDFRILNALSRKGGALPKEALSIEMGIDPDVLTQQIDTLRKKHLVTVQQDIVRIHFQNLLTRPNPSTVFSHYLVTRKATKQNQIPEVYSKNQIKNVAKAAFGQDLAFRKEQIVFVPVFEIEIQNPDDSIRRTYWNAITGREISSFNGKISW